MKQFAFGVLNLKPKEFYGMSLIDYRIMCNGHVEAEQKKWLHTRQISWQVYCSNPPKNPAKTIEAWWPVSKEKATHKRINHKKIQDALNRLNEKLNNG